MEKFTTLTAVAAPFPQKNVDTDFIIRVERCTGTPRHEIGQFAFEMASFLPGGAENPEFVLNRNGDSKVHSSLVEDAAVLEDG